MGEDFFPGTFDPAVVDRWVRVSDAEAFAAARRITREEGILAGESCGIHPQLGLIVLGSSFSLIAVALINQRVTAIPFTRANAFGTRANLQAEAMARNAQVINAMGMIPEGVQVWGQETVESLKAQVAGNDLNIIMTGISKFLRLGTQITILGWGAYLALESELTGGMIIAASIVASRALAPLEGTIEGWRHFVQARSAYSRIKTLLQNSPLNLERLRLPRPRAASASNASFTFLRRARR